MTDMIHFGQECQLHVGYLALLDFEMNEGFLPQPNNKAHAEQVVALAKVRITPLNPYTLNH